MTGLTQSLHYYHNELSTLYCGDVRRVLRELPDGLAQTCVTSPPYFGLRDYGHDSQIGLEQTPEAYVAEMVQVFRDVRRVLKDDGTIWLNIGDSYTNGSVSTGLRPKNLIGIPWRVAFALQQDGWCLRQDIIWHKPNPMPESVTDRCTKAHEYIFLLSKSERYFFDSEAMREPAVYPAGTKAAKGSAERQSQRGVNARPPEYKIYDGYRNRRSVWTVTTKPYKGAHFATFPPALIEPCILAGCPAGGTVLEPFSGSGTTLAVANKHGRKAVGIELNPAYCALAVERLNKRLTVNQEINLNV
jgi:DNA modification methylase